MIRNLFILLTLVLVACGPDGKHIKLDGHLLNMNQGEFLVYSPDGAIVDVDTINVVGGRFTYEGECVHEGVLAIIMPNGQELPVFVSPGNSFSIDGDAHNLKNVKVKGGQENKLMNEFRESIANKDKDILPLNEIKAFIENNLKSTVGYYLVSKYLLSQTPDYSTAKPLLEKLTKSQPENATLKVLADQVGDMEKVSKGKKIPTFSAVDFDGKEVTNNDISKGWWIVVSYASWDFESTNQVRRINSIRREEKKEWHLMAISLDGNKTQCKNAVNIDNNDDIVLYDGKMLETPAAVKFGIHQPGIALIVHDGKIIERNLYGEPLYDFLKKQ